MWNACCDPACLRLGRTRAKLGQENKHTGIGWRGKLPNALLFGFQNHGWPVEPANFPFDQSIEFHQQTFAVGSPDLWDDRRHPTNVPSFETFNPAISSCVLYDLWIGPDLSMNPGEPPRVLYHLLFLQPPQMLNAWLPPKFGPWNPPKSSQAMDNLVKNCNLPSTTRRRRMAGSLHRHTPCPKNLWFHRYYTWK